MILRDWYDLNHAVRELKKRVDYLFTQLGGGGIPDQTGHAGEFLSTNGTTTVWSAAGGGQNFATADLTFTGDRTHDLDGNQLEIQQDGANWIVLNPGGEQAFIRAFNPTGAGNSGLIESTTGNAFGQVTLQGIYNDGGNLASIQILAHSTNSQILASANEYQNTFAASVNFTRSGDDWLRLDGQNFRSQILSTDGTAGSQLVLQSDLLGTDVYFLLEADDDTNSVTIRGDAVANSITHTAAEHLFIAGGETNLRVTINEVLLRAFDPTNDDNVGIFSSNVGINEAVTQFGSQFNGGVFLAFIETQSDATLSKITYTAGHHNFNLQEFADNTAAMAGGLIAGDLYYTDITGDGIVKIVI